MRTPRLAGLGLATIATAAITLAGCDNGSTTPAAGTSAPAPATSSTDAADPAAVQALSAATAKLGETSFTVTATSGSGFKLTGAVDPAKGAGTAELKATGQNTELNVKTLLIAQDLYVQIPGLTKSGTWTHLDVSRLPEGANVGLRPGHVDPVDTANLLGSATDVHSTGGNQYAGTIDLTKAVGLAGVDQVTIDSYGPQAQKVPFTVGVDDQGRLSALTITLPPLNGQQAQPIEILYSGYGSPVDATKPAASAITEAPDSLYNTLSGAASAAAPTPSK